MISESLTRPTRSAGALHEFSGSDMKMQVFGVLEHPDIRRNVATAELRVQLDGYLLHNPQRFVQQRLVLGRKVDQRGDVPLGHDYDVLSPMRPGVTEGEHILGLDNALNLSVTAQGLVTVDVIRHRPEPTLRLGEAQGVGHWTVWGGRAFSFFSGPGYRGCQSWCRVDAALQGN